jgi:hypothetical protein
MKLQLLTLLAMVATIPARAQDLPPFSPVTDEAPLRKLLIDFSELKDPFSAQFRMMEVRTIVNESGSTANVWCGQLNAKNSNGAYAGWSDFVVLETGKKPIINVSDGVTAAVSDIVINHLCKDASIKAKQ